MLKHHRLQERFRYSLGIFQIISDNDLFAGSIRDEFRLGSALVQYRNKNFQYGINYTGWSGKKGDEVHDPAFPSRRGYRDMTHSLYGDISAGLFSAQIQYAAGAGQILQANMGI